MKLTKVIITNFRGYKNRTEIPFENLTTLIGKNDAGKSTILDALAIFFENENVKIDSSDANVFSDSKEVSITCEFTNLPAEIDLDAGEKTSLQDEYLTYDNNLLRIEKVYDCSKAKVSSDVYIIAKHPTEETVKDLLLLKEKDLQKKVKELVGSEGPQKGNPTMRKAIWQTVTDLKLAETKIQATKGEGAKNIWAKLELLLPSFALFQSDRNSTDSDDEVQNPLKAAIQDAIKEVQNDIASIVDKVREKAVAIAHETHEALQSIDSTLASELTPNFSAPAASKWNSLFSISMDTEEGISLNKRGSGVRRMILVGFFKAEAERKLKENKDSCNNDIIYAIEEPETAQHPNNQKILIKAFQDLASNDHCQVILTTHSPALAGELPTESLRFIDKNEEGEPIAKYGDDSVLKSIANTLGVFANPNKDVKVLICVEGPTDVIALKSFSRCLREYDQSVIDLENDPRFLIIPLGGSSLKYWVELNYLKNLRCPEFHIYDNDVRTYQNSIDQVNARGDGSFGTLTKKYEIENYLHTNAIYNVYEVRIDTNENGVPKKFGQAYATKMNLDAPMGDTKSKTKLSKAFKIMTYNLLMERDPEGEIKGWFDKIREMAEANS